MSVVAGKVTKADVQADLDVLEAKYKATRKAALVAVTKPYQVKRLKLKRLLAVLEDGKEEETNDE